jgi:hypothetical protein
LLSALALPQLRPPLPAPIAAAVCFGHHCQWCRGRKPLPPAPCSFHRSCFVALVAAITNCHHRHCCCSHLCLCHRHDRRHSLLPLLPSSSLPSPRPFYDPSPSSSSLTFKILLVICNILNITLEKDLNAPAPSALPTLFSNPVSSCCSKVCNQV